MTQQTQRKPSFAPYACIPLEENPSANLWHPANGGDRRQAVSHPKEFWQCLIVGLSRNAIVPMEWGLRALHDVFADENITKTS